MPISWRWKRWAVTAFLLFHLAALGVWNMPRCAIRERLGPWFAKYMLPTGLWQNWTMFAPEPLQHTFTLQAIVMDKDGIMHEFGFPKMADYDFWGQIPRFRHAKFPCYLALDEFDSFREMAARHVVRRMDLPREAFPVDVELQYHVTKSPPPGELPDPMLPPVIQPIKAYRFPTWEEARP